MMDENEVRLQRAASVRLRRKRDQARKEFLNNRRSGDFGYKSSGVVDDSWDFQSFVQPSSYVDRGGIFSDTELDPCKCNPRKLRQRQSRRVRNDPKPGHFDLIDKDRGIKFTDFGFIDQHIEKPHPQRNENVYEDKRVEPVYEYLASRHQPPPPPSHRLRQPHINRSQENSNQLLSLPVTISEYNQRRENVQLKKENLWLKRDKFFSKWRERFFVVTSSYLKCFESEDESILLWKMELPEIIDINMTDKKGYLTLNITFRKEGKIMLRSSTGIQKWFNLIMSLSKTAAVQQQSTKDFWSGRHPAAAQDVHNVDNWLLDRQFFDNKSNKSGKSRVHLNPKPHHRNSREFQSSHDFQEYHYPAQPQFQSLHTIWPETAPAPVSRKPPTRNSNRRLRPKSCIELSENSNYKIPKNPNMRSEDSGNSSMSTSTPRSVRK